MSDSLRDLDFRRVGIVMMSAVGDAVHALPVVNAIRRHRPGAKISWVLQPGPATLVRGHPAVDEILEFERGRGWRAFADIRRRLRDREFDLVIDLQVYFKAGIVTSFARAPIKLGFDRARARDFNWLFTNRRIPPHQPQHVQEQYFEFLTALGIPSDPVVWGLGPWPEERDWQREFFERIDRPAAAIVVGTSKAEKDWMPERWAQVVDGLYTDFGLRAVLVGGTTEREVAAAATIESLASHTPINALGSGLRRLVSILDGSALVLSPDTGPLHMAVALERPVISLIGYMNPKRVGPYRRYQDLLIDAFGDPGEVYPITMEKRPGRMERISVRDVLNRAQIWRERYATAPRSD
ncbi:MAG TPA: glycosyltransferase family 9 protein [Gemmatimonadaceae bacterium]